MSSSHVPSSADIVSPARTDEPAEILRHGAYICVTRRTAASGEALAAIDLPALAARLGLRNEFEPEEAARPAEPSASTRSTAEPSPSASASAASTDFADARHPTGTIAFLRRLDATPGDVVDTSLLQAEIVLHISSSTADIVQQFCDEAVRLLQPESASCAVLRGGVRPTRYTSASMHRFAYASQRQQESGRVMPCAFLLPLRKTPAWWKKDWMERHTHFLPAYDEAGRMTRQGHMLAAAPGVPTLMRRTYTSYTQPAPDGDYDFVTYFECAEEDVPSFHAVCAALRDTTQNPEWRFVQEGPCWHGRRVATWGELFA